MCLAEVQINMQCMQEPKPYTNKQYITELRSQLMAEVTFRGDMLPCDMLPAWIPSNILYSHMQPKFKAHSAVSNRRYDYISYSYMCIFLHFCGVIHLNQERKASPC